MLADHPRKLRHVPQLPLNPGGRPQLKSAPAANGMGALFVLGKGNAGAALRGGRHKHMGVAVIPITPSGSGLRPLPAPSRGSLLVAVAACLFLSGSTVLESTVNSNMRQSLPLEGGGFAVRRRRREFTRLRPPVSSNPHTAHTPAWGLTQTHASPHPQSAHPEGSGSPTSPARYRRWR